MSNHWFSGDGMLHGFTLQDGRASYRNRWIRTAKWEAEHAAGRSLISGYSVRPARTEASLTTVWRTPM